ncbi:hypothetical protein AB0O76_40485 [Streptomyces sp. NPDC086554]|uniref:hypothetical protein n=1 Tax=Streptomyces sp. NPDC086554 TaxID=3154864 RepID=UPI0034375C77
MPTYQVEVFQTATYRFDIEAENEDAAWELADEFWWDVSSEDEVKYRHEIDDSLIDTVTLKGGK